MERARAAAALATSSTSMSPAMHQQLQVLSQALAATETELAEERRAKAEAQTLVADLNEIVIGMQARIEQSQERADAAWEGMAQITKQLKSARDDAAAAKGAEDMMRVALLSVTAQLDTADAARAGVGAGVGVGAGARQELRVAELDGTYSIVLRSEPSSPSAAAGALGDAAETSPTKAAIGAHSFTKLGLLGKGATGRVYLVRQRGSSELFAMKVMSKKEVLRRNKENRIMRELDILSITGLHPLIVTLSYSFQSKDFLYHVMEYAGGGTLYSVMHSQPQRHFNEEQARFYLAEVIIALEFLHIHGVFYRDLKPENILLAESGHIRLSDFDLSRIVDDVKVAGGPETPRTRARGGGSEVSMSSTSKTNSFVGTAECVLLR